MTVRFAVDRIWDIAGRDGLLVRGRVTGGSLRSGMRLTKQGSTTTVRVDGIELVDVPGSVTIVVDRSASWLDSGTVLVEAAASMAS